jgi:N-acetylglucosaminyldiphosphoundecaprenol N-acetyl-beta-D-mannosaminyltransferase
MLVEARSKSDIELSYATAEMVNADGTPIAWSLRLMGFSEAECVSGPRTVPLLLKAAEERGVPVGFYGGRRETLQLLRKALEQDYPELQIAYLHSPPFRSLSAEEAHEDIRAIAASGSRLLFVGLGSPKQELWVHQNSSLLPCVCLAVGAAFEFLSGEKRMPPKWIQRLGLTWLVRLCQEPRRLAKRNLYSPVFAGLVMGQLLRDRYAGVKAPMEKEAPVIPSKKHQEESC